MGESQVASFADDRASKVGAVDADGVVGRIPDLFVGFVAGLDVCADPSVEQQVDGGGEDGADGLRRGEGLHGLVESEPPANLRGDRNGFGRSGPHPAAGGDGRGVVIRPRGTRQLEQTLALGEGDRGVGVRVEENRSMVEGGHQADVLGQQHAVSEHVAGHVADSYGRELLGLGVDPEFAEVPLDRLPRPAGGDSHLLVVEPGRTAGGEGVAQPEPVGARDGVGDVGERRGSFVRRDDEVRVVAVVANHSLGRDDLPVDEVVRDIEQRADEDPVRRDAFGQPRVAVCGRIGQALGKETALRAGGHDDGVFDRLGLDQTEDLGAEILPAVRPAQPAAGHRAEAQMHTLHARRVHPYFV